MTNAETSDKLGKKGRILMDLSVIKSCPMYFHGNCYGHISATNCEDCSDCMLKQIAERCTEEMEDCHHSGKFLAEEILQIMRVSDA